MLKVVFERQEERHTYNQLPLANRTVEVAKAKMAL